MAGMTEKAVGRGMYETWALGATRQIDILETKIVESAKHFGELAEFFQKQQAQLAPADPIMREINTRLEFIRNWNKHLLS
jgi:hypothetical protein